MDSVQIIDTIRIVDTVFEHLTDTAFVPLNVIDTVKNVFVHTEKASQALPAAVGVIGAVLGAIVGALIPIVSDHFKLKRKMPKLIAKAVEIKDEFIIREKRDVILDGKQKKEDDYAFYCHLKIENNNKRGIANHVRIMVTRFQLFEDDKYTDKSFENGYIPLRWQWEVLDEMRFNKTPSIGSVKWCDLFRVSKSRHSNTNLKLQSAVDIPSVQYCLPAGQESKALVTIVALSDEKESKPQTFCVTWNGKLPDNLDKVDNMKELNITFQNTNDCLKRQVPFPLKECNECLKTLSTYITNTK